MIKPRQLERVIQAGLLVIVALMPFHAFLTTWIGTSIGQRPLVQAWKELVLLMLAMGALALVRAEPNRKHRLSAGWLRAAAGFAVLGAAGGLVAYANHIIEIGQFAIGLKTDLEFFTAAALAAVVATPKWAKQLAFAALAGGVGVGLFVVGQTYCWPVFDLTKFGYGPDTIKPFLYLNGTSNTIRYGGPLGGPNQLGSYLIIPISLAVAATLRRRQLVWLAALPLLGFALFHSYSRSAWIGAGAATIVLLLCLVPAKFRLATGLLLILISLAGATAAAQLIASHPALQEQLLHTSLQNHAAPTSSDSEHLSSIVSGSAAVATNPFGHGLGTAGPATYAAASPNIIENQFLQIGYETGWLGLGLFVTTLILLIMKLMRPSSTPWSQATGAALIGISLAGLFIPTLTDSSTALIACTLAGSQAGQDNV